MASFLSWIGLYNLLGSVLLMAMYYDPVADFVLRKGTEVVSASTAGARVLEIG